MTATLFGDEKNCDDDGPPLSLAGATVWFLRQILTGKQVFCPTCGRPSKIYDRPLNRGEMESLAAIARASLKRSLSPEMLDSLRANWGSVTALSLHQMVRASESGGFEYVPGVTNRRSREEGKLGLHGFIEEAPLQRDDGGRAGYWRLTLHGWRFLLGEIRVPERIETYHGRLRKKKGRLVSYEDCLKNKFNLAELLS